MIDTFTLPWDEGFSIIGSAGAEEFNELALSDQQLLREAGCKYD